MATLCNPSQWFWMLVEQKHQGVYQSIYRFLLPSYPGIPDLWGENPGLGTAVAVIVGTKELSQCPHNLHSTAPLWFRLLQLFLFKTREDRKWGAAVEASSKVIDLKRRDGWDPSKSPPVIKETCTHLSPFVDYPVPQGHSMRSHTGPRLKLLYWEHLGRGGSALPVSNPITSEVINCF